MWEQAVDLGIATVSWRLFASLNLLGWGVVVYFGTRKSLRDCEFSPGCWPWLFAAGSLLTTAVFLYQVQLLGGQKVPVVVPSEVGQNWRVFYHLTLIALLWMMTSTDLKGYYILNWHCWLGMLIGVVGAGLSGEFQLQHLWIDWNQEVPQIQGPYIPEWIRQHRHLHGFAWSLAGVGTGVVLAAGTRWISSLVLGGPALGSGDVYLMGMIGAFLGWQATVVAFALAPLCALLIGGGVRLLSNRPLLPYGPFLALGSLLTLLFWREIWMLEVPLTAQPNPNRTQIFAIRRFFGDWEVLLTTTGLAVGLFLLLLALLRFYKSLSLRSVAND